DLTCAEPAGSRSASSSRRRRGSSRPWYRASSATSCMCRSEEHTSELQSHLNLVCRLLLEKKKKKNIKKEKDMQKVKTKTVVRRHRAMLKQSHHRQDLRLAEATHDETTSIIVELHTDEHST